VLPGVWGWRSPFPGWEGALSPDEPPQRAWALVLKGLRSRCCEDQLCEGGSVRGAGSRREQGRVQLSGDGLKWGPQIR